MSSPPTTPRRSARLAEKASRKALEEASEASPLQSSPEDTLQKTHILTADGLHNIATHKYVGGEYTPLDNLLNPFWFWATSLLPMWLAPNLVTLLGFSNCIVSYSLMWYYSPTFSENVPSWLLFAAGVFTWNYLTLDAMDGKQARRTGASSPSLGQLFDHGCDAMSCLTHTAVAAALFLPGPQGALWATVAMQCGFFVPQWKEYHLHVLDTAVGPFGVTEMQHSLILACVLGGLYGTDWADHEWYGSYKAKECIVFGWAVFCIVASLYLVVTTLQEIKRQRGSVTDAVWKLVPMLTSGALGCSWPVAVLHKHPRIVALTTSVVIGQITVKIIVFAMSKQHYPAVEGSVVMYALGW
eukprot:CAMPEP_0175124914 /NCGR_PEP_ID=MMETSP0087-20121206/3037_1 /TAXON_ID=136419 /ORGANISM="Unknown Unknown, Strain D1" /LENGTH=354 /DNA_ID=CAMNT_0016406717 /DNA_START=26 /DNA_END=1087 /DNA_ORIENTATION=-